MLASQAQLFEPEGRVLRSACTLKMQFLETLTSRTWRMNRTARPAAYLELHYHKTGRNAANFYRIICIRDESVQDSAANTLRSFASVPLLA